MTEREDLLATLKEVRMHLKLVSENLCEWSILRLMSYVQNSIAFIDETLSRIEK